jgi:hypothetical protein
MACFAFFFGAGLLKIDYVSVNKVIIRYGMEAALC